MTLEGELQPTAILEIVAVRDVMMTMSDSELPVNYIR
jgi:hypothetical protein